MLVTTKEMLLDAQKNHYAVGAFNVENLEFVMAVLAAAEETKSPVIMQTTSGTIKKTGLDYFYGMVKAAAERASVPVALHLDHGDGYDRCMKALRTGYTSVMIDGSHESFEDNIALTKSVADAGACMGVPVEAELGKVGGKEDDVEVEGESPYTDPVEAKEFVERTGCTSLAIGVGTAHGVYTEEPHIDQDHPCRRRRAAGSARHLRCAGRAGRRGCQERHLQGELRHRAASGLHQGLYGLHG